MMRIDLCMFRRPSNPRGPAETPGRAKNLTFQMAENQSLIIVSNRKMAKQLLMLCLLNNVGHSFQTYMERWYKGV